MHTKLVALFIAFALAPFAWPPVSSAQIEIIPGSSVRGADLFQSKGCVDCHKPGGVGGSIAPDLTQPNKNIHTPMQLASALWNHAPRMWRAQSGTRRPTLDSMETADLFSYFYSLSYLNAPGSISQGGQLFEQKGCADCHEKSVSAVPFRRSRPLGPPVSTWRSVDDPLAWAEQMWNHSGKIFNELSAAGVKWPLFSTQEMIDLLSYLRSLPEARSQSAAFQPGNPEQGRTTFERSCDSCHSFGKRTAVAKIDLLKRKGPGVLTGYVAAMWNHAPVMHERAGAEFPVLGPGDMSNLIAYLFAQRYFYEPGKAESGALLCHKKNCVVCHEQRRNQTSAPDLTMSTERYSPITMSAAVWRHGPEMFKTIERQKLSWPELKPAEMADLITYLNSRLVARIARNE
jgi:cytochrome c551/c552